MWLHRIGGALFAVLGLTVTFWLAMVLYEPSDEAVRVAVRLGIPGVLLLTLFGVTSVIGGLWFMARPAHAMHHVNRTAGLARALLSNRGR